MKNIFLIIILITSVALFGQAPRGFYGKISGNYTMLNSSDLLASSGVGYGLGINFNMGYHETYNYQVEISYNSYGLNLKSVDQSLTSAFDTKVDFTNINAGFYFNYYVLKPDEDTFFLGPQIGGSVTMAGNFKFKKGAEEQIRYLPYLLNDNSFEIPKVLPNIGFGITGGYNNFRFDLRFDLGMGNLLKDSKTDSYNENNIYTGPELNGKLNNFSFGISYMLLTSKNNR
jgi:hypothetical protein